MLEHITPVILTYNEAPNIGRTLDALTWAKRVVVMDSFSTDSTEEICATYPNVEFLTRHFDTHAQQWNAAINSAIDTSWVLSLDADYCLSPALIEELTELQPEADVCAFRTSFIYKIEGIALKGSLYPPVTTLFRSGQANYTQDGHTQRLAVDGLVADLENKIYHDDRKSVRRWHQSQKKYAAQEAKKLSSTSFNRLGLNDKLRYFGLGPLLVIPYTLFAKGVVLDGWPGLKYTYQRVRAELYQLLARLNQ